MQASARAAAFGCLLLLALSCPAALGSRDTNAPANPLGCVCSDVDPRDDFTKVNVTYSCWQQSGFVGACEQPFMMQTPEEVPEGYCQISCGRCGCCSTFAQVLQNKAQEFLWMLSLTDYGSMAARPGFMATMMVPSDDAVKGLLKQWGYQSRQDVERSGDAMSKVQQVVKLHILPPTWFIGATWTTPFMRSGAQLFTLTPGAQLTARATGGTISVSGPKNAAQVYDKDIPVCKGFINMIDTALVPA